MVTNMYKTDRQMDERTNGRTDERTDGRMEGRTDARMDERLLIFGGPLKLSKTLRNSQRRNPPRPSEANPARVDLATRARRTYGRMYGLMEISHASF